jgi:SAM-dependent methyltransferase
VGGGGWPWRPPCLPPSRSRRDWSLIRPRAPFVPAQSLPCGDEIGSTRGIECLAYDCSETERRFNNLGITRWKSVAFRAMDRLVPTVPFRFLPPRQTVRTTYQVILDREPDAAAREQFEHALLQGAITRHGIAESLIHSEEARRSVPITDILLSMHVSRSEFVRGMPPASRILDLGGTDQGHEDGALVHLGYPYRFDRLVVVDLPPEERHEIYQGGGDGTTVQSLLGPVEFAFHSMTELGRYPDASFDLVYSGQSIEHVTEAEGGKVLAEAYRVLAPGGWMCLDTPNGPAWRIKSNELMNPDHKIEYSCDQLTSALEHAGFEIHETKGLNYMGDALARGQFDEVEASGHPGVFSAARDCLLLALVARKPAP